MNTNISIYNDIKLIDSSFSLSRLYYDLVEWDKVYTMMKNDIWYPLYEALNARGNTWNVKSDGIVYDGDIDRIYNVIRRIDYTIDIIPDYREYKLEIDYMDDIINSIRMINHTIISHPLYRYIWVGEKDHNKSYLYTPLHYSIPMRHYTIIDNNEPYRDDIYDAIVHIDPSIDMNTIYSCMKMKHDLEVRAMRYRSLWDKDINYIQYTNSSCTISWKGSIDDILMSNWDTSYVDSNHIYSTYIGDDAYDVAIDIIISNRMKYGYVVPYDIDRLPYILST